MKRAGAIAILRTAQTAYLRVLAEGITLMVEGKKMIL
jgi:isoleucyl-tRNA synthetase